MAGSLKWGGIEKFHCDFFTLSFSSFFVYSLSLFLPSSLSLSLSFHPCGPNCAYVICCTFFFFNCSKAAILQTFFYSPTNISIIFSRTTSKIIHHLIEGVCRDFFFTNKDFSSSLFFSKRFEII